MTGHRGVVRSAFGVSGVVVLFVLLAGFVAMHGVASTTATGAHHSGITLLVGAADEAPAHAPMAAAEAPGEGSEESHGLMTGCLLVLSGIVVAVALRLFRKVRPGARSRRRVRVGLAAPQPARPPPRRYRLSLCVLRV